MAPQGEPPLAGTSEHPDFMHRSPRWKALHTQLINGFCKAFVKGGKLQALQDCSTGLEATTQPGSGPPRACCQ